MRTWAHPTDPAGGFTLVEVLVAILVLGVAAALLARVLQGTILIHDLQVREPERIRERETGLARQFAGELEEPVMRILPREEAE
jgi:prepilin-type N-terminal cleavage/methylation domain-containing protein